jgi:hypothetical protein
MTTDLSQGETYCFTYTTNSGFSSFYDKIGIWIDFNDDYDFDDAGEFCYKSPSGGNKTCFMNIPKLGTIQGSEYAL